MKNFAFFFPGQGSQSVGMMNGLTDMAIVKSAFDEASDILGQDFWAMATEPNELINETSNTQPLMLAAGVATWRVWQSMSQHSPVLLAGHSLGEYTALVAAEAMSYQEALPLVRYRAEVMQDAVPAGVGAMAAILGLDDDTVIAICIQVQEKDVLQAVNFNSPGQVVIAGNLTAVERAMLLAKEKGAKRVVKLPVSVPSHCLLMKPAAEKLADYLKNVTISKPTIPVLHNADVVSYDSEHAIKDALVRQLFSPVRWVETVKKIAHENIQLSAECGPGKVLTSLTKRIVDDLSCVALVTNDVMNEFSQAVS